MTTTNDTNGIGDRVPAEGYHSVDWERVTPSDLEGATVFDRHDRAVAKVADLVSSRDGHVQAVVLEVAGAAGIGDRTVALSADRIGVQQSDDESDLRVYLSMTDEEVRQLLERVGPTFPPGIAGFPR